VQQLGAPSAAAGSIEGAQCHTSVPIPCPQLAWGALGTLHAAGVAQAARPQRDAHAKGPSEPGAKPASSRAPAAPGVQLPPAALPGPGLWQ